MDENGIDRRLWHTVTVLIYSSAYVRGQQLAKVPIVSVGAIADHNVESKWSIVVNEFVKDCQEQI